MFKNTLMVCLTLLLFSSFVQADVVSEIIAIDRDAKDGIRVWTQYKIDGVEVARYINWESSTRRKTAMDSGA